MLSRKCLFEEVRFQLFSETSENWGRTDIIGQMFPNHRSIKSRAVAKVTFRLMYIWTELRNWTVHIYINPRNWTVYSGRIICLFVSGTMFYVTTRATHWFKFHANLCSIIFDNLATVHTKKHN